MSPLPSAAPGDSPACTYCVGAMGGPCDPTEHTSVLTSSQAWSELQEARLGMELRGNTVQTVAVL